MKARPNEESRGTCGDPGRPLENLFQSSPEKPFYMQIQPNWGERRKMPRILQKRRNRGRKPQCRTSNYTMQIPQPLILRVLNISRQMTSFYFLFFKNERRKINIVQTKCKFLIGVTFFEKFIYGLWITISRQIFFRYFKKEKFLKCEGWVTGVSYV